MGRHCLLQGAIPVEICTVQQERVHFLEAPVERGKVERRAVYLVDVVHVRTVFAQVPQNLRLLLTVSTSHGFVDGQLT